MSDEAAATAAAGGDPQAKVAVRRALISVYDKTGVVEFARALHEEFGVEIISTGGTARTLTEAGIPVRLVEQITGAPEMLDGRVKTLHPRIHAAILADRDNPEHMRQLKEQGIEPIDMVVVNLYPFEKTVADPDCTFEQAIEMIDIGGVALLRAAAKNHRHVLSVVRSLVFGAVLQRLRSVICGESIDEYFRTYCSVEAFRQTAAYDAHILGWLGTRDEDVPSIKMLELWDLGAFRYGENPHQAGRFKFADPGVSRPTVLGAEISFEQSGLSYNNLLDADAAMGLCAELSRAGLKVRDRFSTGQGAVPGFQPGTSGGGSKESLHQSEAKGARPVENRSQTENRSHTGNPLHDHLAPIKDESWTRRHLPHIQRPGASYFITFRVLRGELRPPERDIVLSACVHRHGSKMTLHRAVVMPDHVHLLLTPHESVGNEWVSLSGLKHSIKRYSAQEINKLRGTSGPLWLDESFDRIMRNQREFIETWEYIEANPVTAGLVQHPSEYQWLWASEYGFEECAGKYAVEPVAGSGVGKAKNDRLKTGPTLDRLKTGPTLDRLETGPTVCVFIKHTNACGVGVASNPVEAYRRAYFGDPNAAMGGILACNFEVDAEFAREVMGTYERLGTPLKDAGARHAPGGFFVEVWLAPSFTDDAGAVIRGIAGTGGAGVSDEVHPQGQERQSTGWKPAPQQNTGTMPVPHIPLPHKKWGGTVRLLAVGDMNVVPDPNALQYRSIAGGVLVQTPDLVGLNEADWKVVTKRAPTEAEWADLRLAWLVCKHTKSNAISICKDGMLIGNGAGQMSRVMSCRIATWLARENGHETALAGAAAASDAFFPFADGPRVLIEAGVTALIQPGGSKRDAETIAACDERDVAMVFTGTRHFRH